MIFMLLSPDEMLVWPSLPHSKQNVYREVKKHLSGKEFLERKVGKEEKGEKGGKGGEKIKNTKRCGKLVPIQVLNWKVISKVLQE